ncbi:MAG: chemotaxis-specific protein-glutamate methyltransferase CheB [Gemmataceae bacterium]
MRIAIVNDLALAREVLRRVVQSVPGYTVAWEAADGDDAVTKAAADRPDVILMDLVMPRLDGAEATRQIMRHSPCPVLVVTATVGGNLALVYRAMGAGALDAVETPTLGPGGIPHNAGPLVARLSKLDAALRGQTGSGFVPAPAKKPPSIDLPRIVGIGVSTGGPDALAAVLAALPVGLPVAVLVVQHIAAEYAPGLADALRPRCQLPVRVVVSGDVPHPGTVYLAATDDHLELASDLRLRYTPAPHSAPYRPSVDVLFASLAARAPRPGVGVLLTGMGTDGADGLLKLRQSGWHTIAQDEATCVVYGMPKAAVERRAATEVLPLGLIGPAVVNQVRSRTKP